MEFGNTKDIIYGIFLLFGVIFICIGIVKKKKIIDLLNLGKLKTTEYIKVTFLTLGMILTFVALLGPRKLEGEQKVKTEKLSIYILVDISKSMLAEDVYPNRIEAAKTNLQEIIQNLKGDRVGIIPFSSSAYVQMPLTDDYNIAKNYINVIDPNLISGGGTNILGALKLANTSLMQSKNKVVLIISDGGKADNSIEYAKNNDIKVYSIGVGTEKGSVLPNYENKIHKGFITDDKGNTVVSKINESFLKEMAEKTKGRYYRIDNFNRSNTFIEDISNISREEIGEQNLKSYKEYYQWYLFLGFILILLAMNMKGGIADEKN